MTGPGFNHAAASIQPLPVRIHGRRRAWLRTGSFFLSLTDGTPLTVVAGPKCADNLTWWQITTQSLVRGWALPKAMPAVILSCPLTTRSSYHYGFAPPPQALLPGRALPSFYRSATNKWRRFRGGARLVPGDIRQHGRIRPVRVIAKKANPGDRLSSLSRNQRIRHARAESLWWQRDRSCRRNIFHSVRSGYFRRSRFHALCSLTQILGIPGMIIRLTGIMPFNINFGRNTGIVQRNRGWHRHQARAG